MRSESILLKAPYVEKAFKIIRGELKGFVLDVGCGDGILTYTHKNIIGLDNWDELYLSRYKLADKKFLIPIVKGDMHNLPFKSNGFDCVVINHVLEHSDNPLRVVKEIHRILKNKGNLIIGVPNSCSLQSRVLKSLLGSDFYAYRREHKNFFDVIRFSEMTSKKFNIKQIHGTAFHVHLMGKFFELPMMRRIVKILADNYIRLSQDIIISAEK